MRTLATAVRTAWQGCSSNGAVSRTRSCTSCAGSRDSWMMDPTHSAASATTLSSTSANAAPKHGITHNAVTAGPTYAHSVGMFAKNACRNSQLYQNHR